MANGFGCWKNGFIGIGGVNLSDHARDITLDTTVATLPNDTHGDNVLKMISGLESWSVQATFLQDFASAKVDATISGLLGSSGFGAAHTPFGIEVGADASSSVSATNPRFSGAAVLSSYKILQGAHGANLEAQVTFTVAGQLTRRII
jgi:hypothetical protein